MLSSCQLLIVLSSVASTLATPTSPLDGRLTEKNARALADAVTTAGEASLDVRSLISGLIGKEKNNTDNSGYAPWQVTCPTGYTWVRNATKIGTLEESYLGDRASQIKAAWTSQLEATSLKSPRTPNIGIAMSGGGYRAMINGAGGAFLQNDTQGSVGDILGLANYVSGLSGGSWALSSFFANDGVSPQYLVDNVWNLESNLIVPEDGAIQFYYDILNDVSDKREDTPFETGITDYWSLALSNHLLPEAYRTTGHPNFTMYQLNDLPSVANRSLPFPVIVASERQPGEFIVSYNATLWEFNLQEFGAWYFGADNKTIGGFTSIEYLGSELNDGELVNTDNCWYGFSNLGYVAGTSSTLFNGALNQLNSTNSSSLVIGAAEAVLGAISQQYNDVAVYPNPFIGWREGDSPISNLPNLTLVDGGMPLTNIPLEPLLTPVRNLDAIIAIDSSADTKYSWPNGTAMWYQYQRASQLAAKYNVTQRMPTVPTPNGFVNGGLNTRPTFFGCNETESPIVVYIPNYPWSAWSNTSTFMLEYSNEQASAILTNGRRNLDLNGTVTDWPTCLTCALIDNAVTENGNNRSAECTRCFDRFCWDGKDNNTVPSTQYEPIIGQVPPTMP